MPWVLLVALGQAADLVTFPAGIAHSGIGAESNPLIGALFSTFGMGGVAVVKMTALVLLTYLAFRLQHRHRILLAAAALGFLGAATNLLAS